MISKNKNRLKWALLSIFCVLEYATFFLNGSYSPAKVNLSVIGVICSALCLVIFCFMVYCFSDNKISFAIFTAYLGVALINIVLTFLMSAFCSNNEIILTSQKILAIGGVMLWVLVEPFMQISMLINKFIFGSSSIGHIIIGAVIVIASFYIVYFVSRFIKNRNRKDDENEKIEES